MFKRIIIVLVAALAVLGCEVQTNTKSVDKTRPIVLNNAQSGVSFKAEVYAVSADIKTDSPIGGGASTSSSNQAVIYVQPYNNGNFESPTYLVAIEAGGVRKYQNSVSFSGTPSTLDWETMTPIPAEMISLLYEDGKPIENYVFGSDTEVLNVTIKNNSNQATGPLTVALIGTANGSWFKLSTTEIDSIDAGVTKDNAFTVSPNPTSAEGVHQATVRVLSGSVVIAHFSVIFPVKSGAAYSISLSASGTYYFLPKFAGDNPALETFTIYNTGTSPTGPLMVALSGDDDDSFTVTQPDPNSIEVDDYATFKISPKTGLDAGIYTATVTVRGSNITSKSFTVSFTVNSVEYGIGLSANETFNFDSKLLGYTEIAEKEFLIYNTGTQDTGKLAVSLTPLPEDATLDFEFGSSSSSSISINSISIAKTASFKIKPKPGLGVGTHTATVTVGPDTGNDNPIEPQGFIVSFTVTNQYPVLVLNPDGDYTFKTAYTGYETQPTQQEETIKITNGGNVTIENLKVAITPVGSLAFEIMRKKTDDSGTVSIPIGSLAMGENESFIVKPVGSLSAGTYSATVTVSGVFGTPGTLSTTPITPVSFNVNYKVNDPFLTDVAALAYLNDSTLDGEGADKEHPVLLKMGTIAATDTQAVFNAILNGLGTEPGKVNKYVDLDLSDCTYTAATPFNLNVGTDAGKAKIVSLILPDTATSVGGAGPATGTTSSAYTALETVSGAGITSIADSAFLYCPKLEEANFPKAETIGVNAFYKTALTTASFPEALSIGNNAFQDCKQLKDVFVHDAPSTSIGQYAFSGCTALTTASFPAVTTIGDYAFAATSTSNPIPTGGNVNLTISMKANAPSVGINIFNNVDVAKTVTIKVPVGAIGNYDENWKKAFKGEGNIPGSTGTRNDNITVNVGS